MVSRVAFFCTLDAIVGAHDVAAAAVDGVT